MALRTARWAGLENKAEPADMPFNSSQRCGTLLLPAATAPMRSNAMASVLCSTSSEELFFSKVVTQSWARLWGQPA